MSFDLLPTTFTARQAEQITGIKMVRQRDLRRHGYLPAQEGHAQFTSIDLAEMLVLSSMMRRGIGPGAASGIAKVSAIGIVRHALSSPDAFANMELAECSYPGEQTEQAKADWLCRVFCSSQAHKGDKLWRLRPGNYLIIFADGSEHWDDSVDTALRKYPPTDRRRIGPMTVIDLAAMGKEMMRKSQLPLVQVVPEG